MALALVSCGRSTREVHHEDPIKEIVVQEKLISQDFEGIYTCENYSNLELYADSLDRVSFVPQGQSLNSVNPQNDTLGTHPRIRERNLEITGNKLVAKPRNYNYSQSTHDIEEDVSGDDINGKHRTDVVVEKLSDYKIKVNITIFDGAVNSNINWVIVEREFECSL